MHLRLRTSHQTSGAMSGEEVLHNVDGVRHSLHSNPNNRFGCESGALNSAVIAARAAGGKTSTDYNINLYFKYRR